MRFDKAPKSKRFRDNTWFPQYSRDWRGEPNTPKGDDYGLTMAGRGEAITAEEVDMMDQGMGLKEILFMRLLKKAQDADRLIIEK